MYMLVISFSQESIVNDKIQSVLSRVEEFKHQLDHVSLLISYLYIMHCTLDIHYKLPFFCVICIKHSSYEVGKDHKCRRIV